MLNPDKPENWVENGGIKTNKGVNFVGSYRRQGRA
jgi:hypothetical protein